MASFIGFVRWPVLALTLAAPPASAQESHLREVIANVRSNEELYTHLEVECRSNYKLARKEPHTHPESLEQSEEVQRVVLQGGLYYTSVSKTGKVINGKTIETSATRAYDGETTRFVENRSIVNIHFGRIEDPRQFRPHTWLLSLARINVPLSLWLDGGRSFREHPHAGFYRNYDQVASLDGDEVVGGLRCFRLRCETRRNDGSINTTRLVWLCPDRNYLPVKTMGFAHNYSADLPLETATASDFREIAPGVWLPHRYSVTVYDEKVVREEKRLVQSNSETGTVDKVVFEPRHDRGFFSNVPIPPGSAVYELKNGKIVNSYATGALEPNVGWFGLSQPLRWILGALAVVLAGALSVAAYRRAKRRTSVVERSD